jgi:hypothetical protein
LAPLAPLSPLLAQPCGKPASRPASAIVLCKLEVAGSIPARSILGEPNPVLSNVPREHRSGLGRVPRAHFRLAASLQATRYDCRHEMHEAFLGLACCLISGGCSRHSGRVGGRRLMPRGCADWHGFLPPPPRTGRSVLPSTAHRHPSPGGVRGPGTDRSYESAGDEVAAAGEQPAAVRE